MCATVWRAMSADVQQAAAAVAHNDWDIPAGSTAAPSGLRLALKSPANTR